MMVGFLEPKAYEINSLDSVNFSIDILIFGLFNIVLLIASSIFNPFRFEDIKIKNKICIKIFTKK